jgi:hypothetical protein
MTQITEASVLALAPNATFQSLGDGAVILMIDSGQLYTCNETTEAFLNNIDGQRNFGAILDLLVSKFATDRETLSQDFRLVVDDLQSNGILEVQSGLR